MPGVSVGESVGCNNPLLQFFYQVRGKLTDVEVLSFEVFDLTDGSATSVHSSGAMTLDDCPAGARLGLGRYAASFDATGWNVGTHRITWTFQPVAGDADRKWSQEFEVLDPDVYPTGWGFRMYSSSSKLAANDAFAGCTAAQLQEIGAEMAEQIELWTGRRFDVRYMVTRLNGTQSRALVLQEPIIGIEVVNVVAGGPSESLLDIDLTSLLVYNRHLWGQPGQGALYDHDDRDNPRIEFATDVAPSNAGARYLTSGKFTPGRQNIEVAGVFGYTDPDGTHIGRTPRLLTRLSDTVMYRRFLDPFGQDVLTSQPSRIREAKTRDQQIKFGGASDGAIGAVTGDRIIDDLIMALMRPPHYGAVGNTSYQGIGGEGS